MLTFHSLLPSSTVAQAEVTSPLKYILPISSRTLYLLFWIEAILAFPFYVSTSQPFRVIISCQIKELDYTSYNQAFPIRTGQTEIQSRKDRYHYLRNRAGEKSRKVSKQKDLTKSLTWHRRKLPFTLAMPVFVGTGMTNEISVMENTCYWEKRLLTKQFPKIFNDDVSGKKI